MMNTMIFKKNMDLKNLRIILAKALSLFFICLMDRAMVNSLISHGTLMNGLYRTISFDVPCHKDYSILHGSATTLDIFNINIKQFLK